MADSVPWSEAHITCRKGARCWGRTLPYVIGEGDERQTVYGDWWDQGRLANLLAWQEAAEKALRRLMAGDEVQARDAQARVLAERAARETRHDHGGAWSFATWWEKARAAVRPTPEDVVAIQAETQRRIQARDALRALVIQTADRLPALRQRHPGDPATWDVDQLASAVVGMSDVLLRLARAGFIPHPGDLVPPSARDVPAMRDYTEPQTAGA